MDADADETLTWAEVSAKDSADRSKW